MFRIIFLGAHLAQGFRGSGSQPLFQIDQTVPPILSSKSQQNLNLIWVNIIHPLPTHLLATSFINSEAVKVVNLVFCIIFIRDILANFSIPNSSQSPDIVQNSDSAYVQFWTSGQSFINKSCHHSRASHDIDMKL